MMHQSKFMKTKFLTKIELKKLRKNNLKIAGTPKKDFENYLMKTYEIIDNLETLFKQRPPKNRLLDKEYVRTVEFSKLISDIIANHILKALCTKNSVRIDGLAEKLLNEYNQFGSKKTNIISNSNSGDDNDNIMNNLRIGVATGIAEILTNAKDSIVSPEMKNKINQQKNNIAEDVEKYKSHDNPDGKEKHYGRKNPDGGDAFKDFCNHSYVIQKRQEKISKYLASVRQRKIQQRNREQQIRRIEDINKINKQQPTDIVDNNLSSKLGPAIDISSKTNNTEKRKLVVNTTQVQKELTNQDRWKLTHERSLANKNSTNPNSLVKQPATRKRSPTKQAENLQSNAAGNNQVDSLEPNRNTLSDKSTNLKKFSTDTNPAKSIHQTEKLLKTNNSMQKTDTSLAQINISKMRVSANPRLKGGPEEVKTHLEETRTMVKARQGGPVSQKQNVKMTNTNVSERANITKLNVSERGNITKLNVSERANITKLNVSERANITKLNVPERANITKLNVKKSGIPKAVTSGPQVKSVMISNVVQFNDSTTTLLCKSDETLVSVNGEVGINGSIGVNSKKLRKVTPEDKVAARGIPSVTPKDEKAMFRVKSKKLSTDTNPAKSEIYQTEKLLKTNNSMQKTDTSPAQMNIGKMRVTANPRPKGGPVETKTHSEEMRTNVKARPREPVGQKQNTKMTNTSDSKRANITKLNVKKSGIPKSGPPEPLEKSIKISNVVQFDDSTIICKSDETLVTVNGEVGIDGNIGVDERKILRVTPEDKVAAKDKSSVTPKDEMVGENTLTITPENVLTTSETLTATPEDEVVGEDTLTITPGNETATREILTAKSKDEVIAKETLTIIPENEMTAEETLTDTVKDEKASGSTTNGEKIPSIKISSDTVMTKVARDQSKLTDITNERPKITVGAQDSKKRDMNIKKTAKKDIRSEQRGPASKFSKNRKIKTSDDQTKYANQKKAVRKSDNADKTTDRKTTTGSKISSMKILPDTMIIKVTKGQSKLMDVRNEHLEITEGAQDSEERGENSEQIPKKDTRSELKTSGDQTEYTSPIEAVCKNDRTNNDSEKCSKGRKLCCTDVRFNGFKIEKPIFEAIRKCSKYEVTPLTIFEYCEKKK